MQKVQMLRQVYTKHEIGVPSTLEGLLFELSSWS